MLALMSTLIALVLLFFKTKASLHMVGISGTLFYFGLNLFNNKNTILFALLIFINGLIASSFRDESTQYERVNH
jgi:hypothetical protein